MLTQPEACVPTSHQGYNTHLRGVAAMMQSRNPDAFKEGVAHLMFAGVRPLVVSLLALKILFPGAYICRSSMQSSDAKALF